MPRYRPPKCQAVNAIQLRHQQMWKKCCENKSEHIVDGVPLCGTHFNAVARGPITVFREIEQLDPATLLPPPKDFRDQPNQPGYDPKPPGYSDPLERKAYLWGYTYGFGGCDPDTASDYPNAYGRGYNEGAFDGKYPTHVHVEGQDDGY